MQDSIVLGVKQNGNRVEVVGGPRDIFYEIEGLDLPPIENGGFASGLRSRGRCVAGPASMLQDQWTKEQSRRLSSSRAFGSYGMLDAFDS